MSLVTIKVTFKLTQGHWYACHSKGHTWFLIVFRCNYTRLAKNRPLRLKAHIFCYSEQIYVFPVPACDSRTDDRQKHDDSIYRASIASRGKKIYHVTRRGNPKGVPTHWAIKTHNVDPLPVPSHWLHSFYSWYGSYWINGVDPMSICMPATLAIKRASIRTGARVGKGCRVCACVRIKNYGRSAP